MTSSFTWLDYSEHERRKMLDVIDLFREKDTRDELGIGSVRDAFADLLFPGTSTIQTRARYFLFIPWGYLDLEARRVTSDKITDRARKQEIALIEALVNSDDTDGVIGKLARKSLQRLPSNVYWQGLGVLGIRLFPGSQDQYHHSLEGGFYKSAHRPARNDDGEPVAGRLAANWHPGLPPKPENFPNEATLTLQTAEAEYLQERILTHAPGTLFAFLVDRGYPTESTPFPWEHPQFAEFSPAIREQLDHARNFSEVIHGAALLYNFLLAEKQAAKELVDDYKERLAEWAALLKERQATLAGWDRQRFWEIVASGNPRVPKLTRVFVDAWLDLALSPKIARQMAASDDARRLIHERERFLKRGLARLDNQRALELWNGAAGIARLDYRWGIARRMLLDIYNGPAEGEANA